MYEDKTCRLCEQEDETLEHVLCYCRNVISEPLQRADVDVYSDNADFQVRMVTRAKSFADQVLAKKEDAAETR